MLCSAVLGYLVITRELLVITIRWPSRKLPIYEGQGQISETFSFRKPLETLLHNLKYSTIVVGIINSQY
jgi:hypothetical protein